MKEPVITLTLEEYEELRKEHECLEKEHAELQRKYEASLQEYSRQVEEISACTAVIADLRWKLADLTRRLWGKSSEKRHLPEDAGQLSICFESPSDVNDPVAEEQKTAYLEELIMCLATVYKEDNSVIFKNVSRIDVDGNKLILRDIMGDERVVEGSILMVDLANSIVKLQCD